MWTPTFLTVAVCSLFRYQRASCASRLSSNPMRDLCGPRAASPAESNRNRSGSGSNETRRGFPGEGGVRGPGRQKKARIEMEYSVSVRVSPSSGEADHIETVPADGEEDAAMLREIIETHLRARRAGRRCPDSDWLHRMMLDRGCSCPCKTPHSGAVVAVEQPAAPGGDWYPANPSHNDDHPTCCICMTSVDPAGARRLPCSHAFHPECLARCLQHSALCPLCKMSAEKVC